MDSFGLWRVCGVGLFCFRCEVVQTFVCPSRGMVCNTPAMVHGDQPSRRVAYKILAIVGWLKQMDLIWITCILIAVFVFFWSTESFMCQNVTSIKLNYFFFQCDNGCFALQLSLMILPSRVFHQAPFGFKTAVSPYVGRVLREIRYLEFHDDEVVMCLCHTFRISTIQFNRHWHWMSMIEWETHGNVTWKPHGPWGFPRSGILLSCLPPRQLQSWRWPSKHWQKWRDMARALQRCGPAVMLLDPTYPGSMVEPSPWEARGKGCIRMTTAGHSMDLYGSHGGRGARSACSPCELLV